MGFKAYRVRIDCDGPREWPEGEAPECECCDKPATHYVNIRSGPIRGTDIDTHYVCARHIGMARQNLDRFFGHMRSKNKFLKRA